jgi:hypothetical protein
MSYIAKTLSEKAKCVGECCHIRVNKHDLYNVYDINKHLCEVIDTIIYRITHYTPHKQGDSSNSDNEEEEDERMYMNWNETYDVVSVWMALNRPFWYTFTRCGQLDYMVCDFFNQKLNTIGFQLYTIPHIDSGTDGVGGPDIMTFTLKLLTDD